MADCGIGIFPVCIQCGTDQNPCHIKVVGPTLGFVTAVVMAVSRESQQNYGATS